MSGALADAVADAVRSAVDRPDDGLRPAGELLLRGAMVIDGTGAPPFGPATVRIRDGRITEIRSGQDNLTEVADGSGAGGAGEAGGAGGAGGAGAAAAGGAGPAVTELDVTGSYLLPGLIDAHAHIGTVEQTADADYPLALWTANGITTVREAGCLGIGLDFVAEHARRSAAGTITAPHLEPYVVFGQGAAQPPRTDADIAAWTADVASRGARGVKFFGAPPAVMRRAVAEAKAAGLRTMCHHAQGHAARMTARDTARWGLDSLEHGYGLPDAMLATGRFVRTPADHNDDDEARRFGELGRSWAQAVEPGSPAWNALIDELLGYGLSLVPTFVAHLATRGLDHARGRRYHQEFTTARLQRFYTPGLGHHGSFFSDWGSVQEAAWRDNYRRWMRFVHDYFAAGGRVCPGSDAGFIYNTFGFGLIEELELFCEAGLTAAEAINAATLQAAQLLGIDADTGSVEVGKRADLLVVGHNPLANLKVLSAAGHLTYGDGGVARVVGGPRWTIKNGIVYDAAGVADRVRQYVAEERAESVARADSGGRPAERV